MRLKWGLLWLLPGVVAAQFYGSVHQQGQQQQQQQQGQFGRPFNGQQPQQGQFQQSNGFNRQQGFGSSSALGKPGTQQSLHHQLQAQASSQQNRFGQSPVQGSSQGSFPNQQQPNSLHRLNAAQTQTQAQAQAQAQQGQAQPPQAAQQAQLAFQQPQAQGASRQSLLRPGVMYDRNGGGGSAQSLSAPFGFNSPGIFQNPPRQTRLAAGAVLNFQLTGYLNQQKSMSDGKTCYCPRDECTLVENVVHPCYFTFTAVVSTYGGEPATYIAKEFVSINTTGQPTPNGGNWNSPVSLQLTAKPTNVDIFVNNLGPVIQGKQVMYLNEFWFVDSFTLDLSDYTPSIGQQQPQAVTKVLTGNVVRSQLELSYSIVCQTGYLGPNCDLVCKSARTGPARAICTSRLTNVSSVCEYDNTRTAVKNCTDCGLGVDNDECRELAGLAEREIGVNKAYKVWTIVLGVLLGIFFLLFLVLLILYILSRRRKKSGTELRERQRVYQQQQPRREQAGFESRPLVSNPLIQEDWNKPPAQSQVYHRGAAPLVDTDSIQSDPFRPPVNYNNGVSRREAQV